MGGVDGDIDRERERDRDNMIGLFKLVPYLLREAPII